MRDEKDKEKDMNSVKHLIEAGKEKGFLTYEEVNTALPMEIIESEQLDDIMIMFNEMDISIVDNEKEGLALREKLKATQADSEEFEPKEDTAVRSNDPVRMYLKKMGAVSLLTREGEVEIAKRIEEGENEVLEILLRSPVGVREIIAIGEKLKKGTVRVRDLVRGIDEEDENFDEKALTETVLRLIEKIRRSSGISFPVLLSDSA